MEFVFPNKTFSVLYPYLESHKITPLTHHTHNIHATYTQLTYRLHYFTLFLSTLFSTY